MFYVAFCATSNLEISKKFHQLNRKVFMKFLLNKVVCHTVRKKDKGKWSDIKQQKISHDSYYI